MFSLIATFAFLFIHYFTSWSIFLSLAKISSIIVAIFWFIMSIIGLFSKLEDFTFLGKVALLALLDAGACFFSFWVSDIELMLTLAKSFLIAAAFFALLRAFFAIFTADR